MNLRGLLHHIHPARRHDITERHALICLQEAARQVCRETLRYRGMMLFTFADNSLWTAGVGGESYLRPTQAQLGGTLGVPVNGASFTITDQAADAEVKILDSVRVLSAKLFKTAGSVPLHLAPVDLPGLRIEGTRMLGIVSASAPPTIWADTQGGIALWPGYQFSLGYDKLIMEVAVCPAAQEFENLSLPAEAEAAVVEEAIARAYEFVGAGQSFPASEAHRGRSKEMIKNLLLADGVNGAGGPTISNRVINGGVGA
jgi:hypothetical protein